jgi:hypothetical protein
MTPTDEGVRDFSRPKTIKFRLDHVGGQLAGQPEYFNAVPALPALHLVQFANAMEQMDEKDAGEQAHVFKDIYELVLTEESAERFIARMSDKNDPISLPQAMEIVEWIMSEFGMRPTQPSEASSDQSASPGDGTSSTPSASNGESVLQPSTPATFSTSSTHTS